MAYQALLGPAIAPLLRLLSYLCPAFLGPALLPHYLNSADDLMPPVTLCTHVRAHTRPLYPRCPYWSHLARHMHLRRLCLRGFCSWKSSLSLLGDGGLTAVGGGRQSHCHCWTWSWPQEWHCLMPPNSLFLYLSLHLNCYFSEDQKNFMCFSVFSAPSPEPGTLWTLQESSLDE